MNKYWNLGSSTHTGVGDVEALKEEYILYGDSMLKRLKQEKNYKNRTYNLISSYAYAIFHDGKVLYSKRVSNQSIKDKIINGKRSNASEQIDLEIKRQLHEADPKKVVFVIFSSMFYSGILESNYMKNRGYRVIKRIIRPTVERLAKNVKGKLTEY